MVVSGPLQYADNFDLVNGVSAWWKISIGADGAQRRKQPKKDTLRVILMDFNWNQVFFQNYGVRQTVAHQKVKKRSSDRAAILHNSQKIQKFIQATKTFWKASPGVNCYFEDKNRSRQQLRKECVIFLAHAESYITTCIPHFGNLNKKHRIQSKFKCAPNAHRRRKGEIG